MEFFGVEVPAGNPTTCSPGYGMYLHVSQAALGDSKGKPGKAQERVVVKVSVEPHNEIVLGTLVEGKCDQMHLDLVFDRDFTISHTGKTSSVYICGYRTEAPEEEDDDDEFDDEDEDEEEKDAPTAVPIVNGAAEAKSGKAGKSDDGAKSAAAKATDKAANTIATAIAKVVEKPNLKKQVVDDDDDSEEEDDESEDEGLEHPFLEELASESDDEFDAGDDSDEDMEDDDDDEEDDDDEDDSDESEEEELKTPEVKAGKKRSAAQPVKAAEKKAKTEASPKPEQVSVNGKKGKKSAQATPEKKEAAPPKTPTTDKAAKAAKTPKGTPTAPPPTPVSAKKIGDHKCTGCERTFTTESALSQHAAAKHK